MLKNWTSATTIVLLFVCRRPSRILLTTPCLFAPERRAHRCNNYCRLCEHRATLHGYFCRECCRGSELAAGSRWASRQLPLVLRLLQRSELLASLCLKFSFSLLIKKMQQRADNFCKFRYNSAENQTLVLMGYLSPLFLNLINLTLYTPFQCTLPHTFTYRACPFSVHCLPTHFRLKHYIYS